MIAPLRARLPEGRILDDPEALRTYGGDWTHEFRPAPIAVAFPRTVEEVVAIVRYANETGLPLVPSGGRTGLSGGAVAARGELVVSLRDLDRILDLSEIDRTVTVEAGAVTATVQAFARERGLSFPVDFASSGSSQIGGNVATNAGGVRVVRHGAMREWIAGLRVVTGGGDVVDLNRGLVKNATGYDLRHLMIGSEGTLGIIVEATLRLTDPPGPRAVAVLALSDLPRMLDLFLAFRRAVGRRLQAFELFSEGALERVVASTGLGRPFAEPAPWYALIEVEIEDERSGDASPLDPLLAVAARAIDDGLADDAIATRDERECRELWRLREAIAETLAPHEPWKIDVSVVISKLPAFLAAAESLVRAEGEGIESIWFGHLGDGNLHLSLLRPDGMARARFDQCAGALNLRLGELVGGHGGSVSAEHGIGLLKRELLPFSRSAAEIEWMRAIKRAFDPNGILNPGKIFG